MKIIRISFDHRGYKSKPEDYEIGNISIRVGNNPILVDHNNVRKIINAIATKGHAFAPATFYEGLRKKDSFKQTQLFALDFDETLAFDKAIDRAKQYELPILFAYETLSSTNQNRFRIVFLNDISINKIKVAEIMQLALMTIYPEADKKCKDVSRMYFGGKSLLYYDESYSFITIESLFRNMTLYLKDQYGFTHYRRKVAEFARITGIRLNEKGLLDVSIIDNFAEDYGNNQNGKNLPISSIILSTNVRKLPNESYQINFGDNHINSYGKKKKTNYHSKYRSEDLIKISSNCRLYQEFESGSRILHHQELYGIATNLIQIGSGATKFKDIIKLHSYFDDRPKKYSAWDYYLHYFKNNGSGQYKPESCDGFCPHKDQCPHGVNILTTCIPKSGQMEKLAGHEKVYVTLEEAEEDFRQQFRKFMDSYKNKVYIIKAQTGIGKSKMILEEIASLLSQNPTLRIIIAVPTLALKKEICERARAMGIEIVESPSLREIEKELPAEVWDYIEKLYSSGRSPIPYLKKLISEDHPECAGLFKQYLRELEAFKNCEGCAITTHKMLQNMDFKKYDLIITDEDIIFGSVIQNKIDISISDLKKLYKKFAKIAPTSALTKKLCSALKKSDTDELFTLPKVNCDIAIENIPMGFDIPAFAAATHFVCRKATGDNDEDLQNDHISFLAPTKFRDNIKNTKCIMVSATVDETICGYYFGKENIEFYSCKEARYKGTLNQFYDKSMSRSCINKDIGIIGAIKRCTKFLHTISFKSLLKHYVLDMTFGNTAGRDFLKGQDLDVIGTPHQTEWIYKLCAFTFGLVFDEEARLKPGTTVEHNGYKFCFMTYADEVLRAIQFYIIESELEQAVGRARLLRENCTVNVFSNFPLSQAIMKESEYSKVN